MEDKTADEIVKEFEKFKVPETLTTSIYNKEINKLFNYLWDLSKEQKRNTIIYCIPTLFEKVKQIGDYFKIDIEPTNLLPEDTLFACVDKNIFNNFNKELEWL